MTRVPHTFRGLGAAFFPEHHARETWPEYVDLMGEAGLTCVRMGEFAWDKYEPEEGRFDFEWMDEVLGLLARHDIGAIMCTPTAVPPLWACQKYPDLCPVLEDDRTFGFGIRRYTCPTSLSYRTLCERVVTAMGERYGASPQVIGWQIDNEIGHPFCFCETCLWHFREWCERRFGTIERFNDALCTHFWGQSFRSFGEIVFPNHYPNPSLWLTYHRFESDMILDCFGAQVDWLRAAGAVAPITTNMMPTWYGYDHAELAQRLDVIAADHYFVSPERGGSSWTWEAFTSAYLRGMMPGTTLWFDEGQCGPTGAGLPLPGQMRAWALSQIGLGADQINFFRWDMAPSGGERGDFGLLKPSREPGRLFFEMQQTCAELRQAAPLIADTRPAPAEVAILYTWENHCDFARWHHPPEFSAPSGNGYSWHLAKHCEAVAAQNIPVDFVYPGGDFTAYKLIVAPALEVLPQELADKLAAFVAGGGKLLLTCYSGILDENAKMWDRTAPGPLREVLGVGVVDSGRYRPELGELRVADAGSGLNLPELRVRKWVDEVRPDEDTQVLATYAGPEFAGVPVFTRHPHGQGEAYYLGTLLEDDEYLAFYRPFLATLGLRPLLDLPEGVHVSLREKPGLRLWFLVNGNPEARTIELPGTYTNAVTGESVNGRVSLSGRDVAVLAERR